VLGTTAELLLDGKKIDFLDLKKSKWKRLQKLTVKKAYRLLRKAHLRSLPDYKEHYATQCVPPPPQKDSPAAVSYPFNVKRADLAAKYRWVWLSQLAVAPKVRQFLFLKWHGKLYLGATREREATCRFLREDGTPCGQKDSIKHFSLDCPTARAALDYARKCWCEFWDQLALYFDEAVGLEFAGNHAVALALGLLSWCLWRARSISSISGERGRLVGARSIIADWRNLLTTTLQDMCRVRAGGLDSYTVGGRWLKTINKDKNIYELVIAFPALPSSAAPSPCEPASETDSTA
jgi:hypothetical protein